MIAYNILLGAFLFAYIVLALWIWLLTAKQDTLFRLSDEARLSLRDAHKRIRELEDKALIRESSAMAIRSKVPNRKNAPHAP